jgi:hypothetical protein
MVEQCSDRTQLSISPQKLVMIAFTRKRDDRSLNEPSLFGHKQFTVLLNTSDLFRSMD